MKANELRLGNHINYEFKKDSGNKKEIPVTIQDIKYIETQSMFYYTPIVLTEEWMLNLGFSSSILTEEKEGNTKIYFNIINIYQINENLNEFMFFSDNADVKIKYLHELQNLYFALTREELKVK